MIVRPSTVLPSVERDGVAGRSSVVICGLVPAGTSVMVLTTSATPSPMSCWLFLSDDSGGLAAGGAVAVVDEDDVAGDRGGLRRGERVERRLRLAVRSAAPLFFTYQTRLASVRVTVAGAEVTPLLMTV